MYCLLLLRYVYEVVNPMLGCTTSVLPDSAKIYFYSGQSNVGCTTRVLPAIAKICLCSRQSNVRCTTRLLLLRYVYVVVNPMLGCTTSVVPAIAKICL